ncbi:MAG: hypothetical protein IKM04_02965 [Clostridia bacterium]|nr:hypothetical protein [Clostridia bacterium]
MILTDCPDFETAILDISNYNVTVSCGTNPYTVAKCRAGECERVCREIYRKRMHKNEPVTMSNTWGDRNGFKRVCEEFVLREIDKACSLGIDIVQIDDGWQFGSTAVCSTSAVRTSVCISPTGAVDAPQQFFP